MARCVPGREQAPPAQQTGGLRRSELQVLQACLQGGQPLLSHLLGDAAVVILGFAGQEWRHAACGAHFQDASALRRGGGGGGVGRQRAGGMWLLSNSRTPCTSNNSDTNTE